MCLIASKHRAAFARLYPMNLLTWLTAQAAGLGLKTDNKAGETMTFFINGVEADFDNKTCTTPLVVRVKTGRVKATPKAVLLISKYGFQKQDLMARYRAGDWGNVTGAQSRRNELALKNGSNLLALYRLVENMWLESVSRSERQHLPTIWIETRAVNDAGIRSLTTILCAEDW